MESSLTLGWPELQQEVGYFLGHGRTILDWSATQLSEIAICVQAGVRRVYYPLPAKEGDIGHEWSFLRPTTTMVTADDVGEYDMPDDFGRLVGNLHFAADEYKASIIGVSLSSILEMRSRDDRNDSPTSAAVRYKASDGTAGQKQEILFWPTPDDAYTLSYEYEAYNGALSDAAPYPLGGMQLSELYIESCLSVAEQRFNREVGIHTQAYGVLLADAIERDKKHGARNYGQMGHKEVHYERIRHGDTGGSYPVTYLGVDL